MGAPMQIDAARALAAERRGRLAAERLLEQKQAELHAAYRKLDAHARHLSQQVTLSQAEVEEVRDENKRVITQLGEATEKIEIVEGQLWQALTAIRDGFAMFDADGRMELANPAYLAVFDGLDSIKPGVSISHIMDAMIEEGIVDLEGEGATAWRARMLQRWNMDPIPDETLRLWSGRFIKISDRRRPQGGVVSLCVDITELMRMWSAVDELPDGFVLYDDDDRLVTCNRRYREIYAASAPAIVPGASFEDIVRYGLERGQYTGAIGREAEWLEERLDMHRQATYEAEQALDDGSWLRVYERETRDGGRVGLRIDISAIKQDQQRLKEVSERAEAANRAKSAFLANMSHEIRTPMNGVVGMADLVMETGLTDEQVTYVETIRNSGEALLVIINDILDYSKIEAERLDLHPEPFDLERAVHDVLMLLQPAAREKGLSLLIDYDMFLPISFIADPGRVRQVLTNLVGNAVKFTQTGHVKVSVVGLPTEDDNTAAIHLTVEDTGIGIPKDKIDHVFGEFNQVEDDRNRQFEGTGLGLAITQKLVRLMGGEIWAESEFGQGSVFGVRLVLPIKEPPEYLAAKVPAHLRRALVAAVGEARGILEKQLGVLGLETVCCDSAADAIARFADGFDLVVADSTLPDMPGEALLETLRDKDQSQGTILLSEDISANAQTKSLVADAVLQKPVARRALFSAIETLDQARNTVPDLPETPPTDPQEPDEDTAPETERLDVLVAEDNKTNQLVFSKMAASFDVDLRFANNGVEAVAAYKEKVPDLIFMDISMPVMDGKAATGEIRAIEGDGPRVPIIAVTAHAMSGDREMILAAGLDDYLTKPLRKAALGQKIAEWSPGSTVARA